MSKVTIVLLVILAVLIIASIALYFFGKKAEKKQAAQQEQLDAAAQTVSKMCIRDSRTLLNWRHSILLSFGYDPLKCPKCGTSMLVLEVYHKKTALFERYRKVMGYG